VSFSTVDGGEGADKSEVLGPETTGIKEDLHEEAYFFARCFPATPNLIGITEASGDGINGQAIEIHSLECEGMAFEKIKASRDLAPMGDLEETDEDGACHAGKENNDAQKNAYCDAGADLADRSREFCAECRESQAQFFSAKGHKHFLSEERRF